MSNIATNMNAVEAGFLAEMNAIEAAEQALVAQAGGTPTMAQSFEMQMEMSKYSNQYNMISTALSDYEGQATNAANNTKVQ
jgi:hypothetical protein